MAYERRGWAEDFWESDEPEEAYYREFRDVRTNEWEGDFEVTVGPEGKMVANSQYAGDEFFPEDNWMDRLSLSIRRGRVVFRKKDFDILPVSEATYAHNYWRWHESSYVIRRALETDPSLEDVDNPIVVGSHEIPRKHLQRWRSITVEI